MTDTMDTPPTPPPPSGADDTPGGFRYRQEVALGAFLLYVFLLWVGTMGELLDIKWIRNLPIY
ncbi:MAG: hypothetical protein OEW11_09725 [Nitrospirota bacterium]|nr:hypothetical protein [Nitrospirota bacterium]